MLDLINDRRNLITFYIWGVLIIELVLNNVIGGNPVYSLLFSRLFPFVYYLWTFYIIGSDIYHKNLVKDKMTLCFAAMMVLAVLSWILCPTGHSIGNFGLIVHQIFLSYLVMTSYAHYSSEDNQAFMARISKSFVIFVGVINLLNVIMYITGKYDLFMIQREAAFFTTPHEGSTRFRYYGLHEYQTSAGYVSLTALALSLYLGHSNKMNGLLCAVSVFLSSAMIYLCDTRNAILQCGILLLGGLYLFLRRFFSIRKTCVYETGLITVNAAAFCIIFREKVLKIINSIAAAPFDTLNRYSTFRMQIWRDALQLVRERPLIGYGWYNNYPIRKLSTFPHCHNMFITVAYWAGIPCLILFVAFIFLALKKIIENRNLIMKSKAFWLAVFVLCILFEGLLDIAVIGDLLRLETAFFWICLGYLLYGIKENHGSEE